MFVDEVTIEFVAGDGGRGAVAFNKVRLSQGPTGGDGGAGGSVYLEGVADLTVLNTLSSHKIMRAGHGKNGRGQFLDGAAGSNLIVRVPIGSRVTNLATGFGREIESVGERMLVAGGGRGGRGNFKFRSSTNTTPKEFEEGSSGDNATYRIEMRLIADVGLIGLPSAGKSSLLNALTGAKSRVGNYAFTTLEPHLGAYYGVIIADIPGLIEGAHLGKGLGYKFLKHIERTRVLFHLISCESDDPVRDYKVIREELRKYGTKLGGKEEYVFLAKSDAVGHEEVVAKQAALRKTGITAIPVSIIDDASMDSMKKILNEIGVLKGAAEANPIHGYAR